MASSATDSEFVTLVSGDGFEFVLPRSAACVSGTIRRMLEPSSSFSLLPFLLLLIRPRSLLCSVLGFLCAYYCFVVQVNSPKHWQVAAYWRISVESSSRRSASTFATTRRIRTSQMFQIWKFRRSCVWSCWWRRIIWIPDFRLRMSRIDSIWVPS